MKFLLLLCLLTLSAKAASLTNTSVVNLTASGYATLSGTTNRLTDNGTNVLRNSVALVPATSSVADGLTAFPFNITTFHATGNLWEVKNAATNVWTLQSVAANQYSQRLDNDGTGQNYVDLSVGAAAGNNGILVHEGGAEVFFAGLNGIATSAPGVGAAANWKLGNITTEATVVLNLTNYINVTIGGTNYKFGLVQ